MENAKNYRDIKLITIKKEDINKCHCLTFIQQNASQKIFFATKFRKTKINMGKLIYYV